jgi:hypothetical protein
MVPTREHHAWQLLLYRGRGGTLVEYECARWHPVQDDGAFKYDYGLQLCVRFDWARINRFMVYAQNAIDLIQDDEVGFSIISTDDIDDIGIKEVIRRIRARIANSPVYLRQA